MGSSRWALSHSAKKEDVSKVVKNLGFDASEDDDLLFVKRVSSGAFWREVKIRIKTKEVTTFVYIEEDSTTETYFDYLIQCGYIIGRLASRLETLPVHEVGEVPYEWDEDEDEDLEGDNG